MLVPASYRAARPIPARAELVRPARVPSKPAARIINGDGLLKVKPSSGPDWSTVAGGSRLAGGSSSGRLAGEPTDQAAELGSRLGKEPGWLEGTEPVGDSQLKGWQDGTEPTGE